MSEINYVNNDLKIMHPNVLSVDLITGQIKMIFAGYVPSLINVISIIEAPYLYLLSGQQYHISKGNDLLVEKLISPEKIFFIFWS